MKFGRKDKSGTGKPTSAFEKINEKNYTNPYATPTSTPSQNLGLSKKEYRAGKTTNRGQARIFFPVCHTAKLGSVNLTTSIEMLD
jgi:hypothetical protein